MSTGWALACRPTVARAGTQPIERVRVKAFTTCRRYVPFGTGAIVLIVRASNVASSGTAPRPQLTVCANA
eukprot:3888812-Prymnesium_polylepis.1